MLLPLLAPAATLAQHAGHEHAEHSHDHGEIGVVDFRVSCDPAVRDDFDRAVSLLHHMMYIEARRAFERIAEQHPECAMSHWGVATTPFQPLWPGRPGVDLRVRAITRASSAGDAVAMNRSFVAK